MYPTRRGTEIPVARRHCSGPAGLFPYCSGNEAPFPSPTTPLMRGQHEFRGYEPNYLPSYAEPAARQRGYVDHQTSRFGGFPGFDGGMHGMSPVVQSVRSVPTAITVPTSITVPPSRQLRNTTSRREVDRLTEASGFQFQNGQTQSYASGGAMPLTDPPLPGFEQSVPPFVPQKTVQRLCALTIAHCSSCKTDNCFFRDACSRVKMLWRHINTHRNLREPCSLDMCYPVRQEMDHFRNCQSPRCFSCSSLKTLVQEIQQQMPIAQNRRVERELMDTNASCLFPGETGMQTYPVRRSQFQGRVDDPLNVDFGGMEPVKQEFHGDLDAVMPILTASSNSSFLIDPTDNFGVESSFRRPPPSALMTTAPKPSEDFPFQLGTSLFETFDPVEIESYLRAVRGIDVFPSKPDESMKDRICAVCMQGEQTFQPIQLYCDCCFARIKRGGMYWKSKADASMQICACHKCFSTKKNGSLTVGQISVPHGAFQSCKNDECVTETWVECDKCGYWIHSSCGLFNRGENNDHAKYMCPFCLKEEMELGHRTKPLTKPISMWGADELAECMLSERIQARVNQEIRNEMMKLGVPENTCHPLTVRVLMATKKVTKVQPIFSTSFQDVTKEYPYYQKVIGVFQKIHGVDVLLFCMYVQEYSDDCPKPNQRWVNLEYIDSVKHFTPDMKTIEGDSMRSVVYKETLLAYVEFVKRCGFEVFYIWACPPGKEGEDYILHCKPKNQRIPSADRLRIWYKELLRTAKERSIVTHDSNLMDTFFTCGMDRAVGRPFNAVEMPYFEGDYWPGEAEKILKLIRSSKGVDYCRKPGEKRKTRGEMSVNESLENGLMQNLPFPRWSDFMVWHLQEPCSLCQHYITRGNKYVYHFENTNSVNKMTEPMKKRAHFEGIKLGRQGAAHSNTQFFQICETCYRTCKVIKEGKPIPDCVDFKELEREKVVSVTSMVGDLNKTEESRFSEIFESRQAFLAFCKGNHYQFDTLQHAKHSTMMLLYHLHNTKAPVFPTLCRGCGIEVPVSADTSKRELRTPDYCRTCTSSGNFDSVTFGKPPDPSYPTDNRTQLFKLTENFEHAAYCQSTHCMMPECHGMKDIFKHVRQCEIGAGGPCRSCRFFALFVQRHAHFCNQPCTVPDCERIKAIRKQQMRLDQAQRSRIYDKEASGSSSSC